MIKDEQMQQISLLKSKLEDIGFKITEHENLLQITGVEMKESKSRCSEAQADEDEALSEIDLEKVSHAIQVVIEVEDPENIISGANKLIFQNCSLKVYYEGWELQELAKIIKFNIAGILNDNGIFHGMNFEFPKTHDAVLVP